ncbi:MAG TPA: hypothetical protein VMS76_01525 [Planctomycetota bacterium]|nr:hypothetical protein [Planctomycetota bacterium]
MSAFETPSELELASVPRELPSHVRPDGIKGLMTHIDHRWDLVAAAKDAGWRAPASHPDIDPEHEVGMIENALRDLAAMDEDLAAGKEFRRFVAEALGASQVLEAALDGSDWGGAEPRTVRAPPWESRSSPGCISCLGVPPRKCDLAEPASKLTSLDPRGLVR